MKTIEEEFELVTNVPPPLKVNYPFRTMDVGESFVQPDKELGQKLRGIIYQYGKRNGKRFSVKEDETSGGYRCWRIE
jgi:hypothetical protein